MTQLNWGDRKKESANGKTLVALGDFLRLGKFVRELSVELKLFALLE